MAREILIADGDKADQKEFKAIFEATDYNLVFSDDGEQVLLRLRLFKPDLIIIGESLKEKKGSEVFKSIKGDPESKDIPVVLFSNVLKGIGEEDRKRLRADGVITPPLLGNKTLDMVDRLLEEGEVKGKREGIVGREMEWESIADKERMNPGKKEDFSLDGAGEDEAEEIIDLVDVVEEPETKMSIQNFVGSGKEAPVTEITRLETWEKLIEEQKPIDQKSKFGPDEKEREAKGLSLKFEEEVQLKGEVSKKENLEKIELEEILKKVEQMTPSIEKEWPPEVRQTIREERRRVPEREVPQKEAPPPEAPSKEYAGLAEFEAALKKGLGEKPLDQEFQSSFAEKPAEESKVEISKEIRTEPIERQEIRAPKAPMPAAASLNEGLIEVKEEEFADLRMEEPEAKEPPAIEKPKEKKIEVLEEIEISEAEKEEVEGFGEAKEEGIEILKETEALKALEEEIRVFEKPKPERAEIFEEVEIPEAEKEEVRVLGEEKEERIEILEETGELKALEEEIRGFEKPKPGKKELFEEVEVKVSEAEKEEIGAIEAEEEERIQLSEAEEELSNLLKEEVRTFEKAPEEGFERPTEATAREVVEPEVTTPGIKVPILPRKEVLSQLRPAEQEMEEIISRGAREIMEGFITKLVPDMTENIINLTIERIERMVREIVPEIAEKMIQEEIQKLKKGEEE